MNWLESAVAQSNAPLDVDITTLGVMHDNGPVTTIQVCPVSAAEYQTLKAHPEVRGLTGDDRDERLGMVVTFEMMRKADNELKWDTFKQMPIQLLNELAVLINAAMKQVVGDGEVDGDGLGE